MKLNNATSFFLFLYFCYFFVFQILFYFFLRSTSPFQALYFSLGGTIARPLKQITISTVKRRRGTPSADGDQGKNIH